MKLFFLPFIFATALGLAGCAKKSSYVRVQVLEATYLKIADIRDPAALSELEGLLEAREAAPPNETDFFYVLEIQTAGGRTFWHYNPDGAGVEIRDGKRAAFFRIKDRQAFNRLIGLDKKP